MGDLSGKITPDMAISYGNYLVLVLKEKGDINALTQRLNQSKTLRSSCDAEINDGRSLLEDYQKKIDECKQKREKAKLEVPADAELDLLQKELGAEHEKQRLLMEELRVINNEISDLEHQRISVEEQKQALKKLEQEELRAQRKLSMYASVTNIIPNLDDRSKISDQIVAHGSLTSASDVVDRQKRSVQKFESDPAHMTAFDTCQSIWKMINR